MENEYVTRSINEASFLYLNQAVLISAIDDKGYESFIFDDKDDFARHLAEQFYEEASAPARALLAALGQLRKEASQARQQRRQFHTQGTSLATDATLPG